MSSPELPTVDARTASFNVARAGAEARNLAAQQGADPRSVDALMEAAAGPTVIAGLSLQPWSMQILWVLQKVKSPFVDEKAETSGLNAEAITVAALCFNDPMGVFKMFSQAGISAVEERAFALAARLTPPIVAKISAYISQQFASVAEAQSEIPNPQAKLGEPQSQPTPPPAG